MPNTPRAPLPKLSESFVEVLDKAQLMLGHRFDLWRLDARGDLRQLLTAAAFGGVALVAASVSLVAGAAGAVWLLSLWIPLAASLLTVAAVSGLGAAVLVREAAKRLPGTSPRVASLHGGHEPPELSAGPSPALGLEAPPSEKKPAP